MKSAMRPSSKGGKPTRSADPEKTKGDGAKAAMADRGKRSSKLSPMGAAEKRVR